MKILRKNKLRRHREFKLKADKLLGKLCLQTLLRILLELSPVIGMISILVYH